MRSSSSGRRRPSRTAAFVILAGLFAFSSLVAAGCNDGANPDLESFEISGVVTDAETGGAIRSATVTFTSDTLYTETTETDRDGHYAMFVETDTPYGRVLAEKDGYEPASESVFFDSSERRVDIEMNPAAAAP